MKVWVTQRKNGCWCGCKELDNWSSFKNYHIWSPSTCDSDCNKACKIKYLDTKNCSCKKRLFGKLVLARENEILNTIKTSLHGKKVNREKISAIFTRFHW